MSLSDSQFSTLNSPLIPPGYKQTEVGVIPEDWDVTTISQIFQFKQGVQSPVEQQAQVERDGYKRFIRIIDLTDPSVPWRYIADPGSAHHLASNDLFMVRYGSPGLLGIGHEGVIANNLFRLIPKKKIDAGFYFHFISSKKADIADISGSSTMPAVNFSTLSVLKLIYLPLPEQQAIATALSDVDALLAGLDQLITKKRDLKQAAMQQLLTGQTRLPGFYGEWEVKRLGDVVQIKKGQLITSSTLKQGEIPVIAGGKQPAYFHAAANRFGRTVTISASGASAGYVAIYDQPIFASDCSTISGSESYCLEFIFYQLLCKQQTIYKAQTGGAQPHVHAKDLNPFLFPVPPLPEQTAIAQILTDMDAELTALKQRRDKTRALKQAMMQELLTGRTRLI